MTRDEFKILVKAMKAVFTQPSFIPDQDAFDVWYNMLKDLDYAVSSRAIQIHIQTEEKPPSVASIRKQAMRILKKSSEDLNETEAWSMVWKAICNSGYHAEEEYEKLPPIVQAAVGSPNQLRNWALDSNLNESVESSNFKRVYRMEQQRKQDYEKLSPDVSRFIKEKTSFRIESGQSETE